MTETPEVVVLGGKNGILSGAQLYDPEDEQRRQKEREWNERVTQYAAKVQELCDRIDAAMAPYIKNQMAVENEKQRISPQAKKDLKDFEAYCAKFDPVLPHLPAPPQAVAAYLSKHLDRGSADVARLARNISIVHCAVGVDDPTQDVLVKALLRLSRETDKSPPQPKEN